MNVYLNFKGNDFTIIGEVYSQKETIENPGFKYFEFYEIIYNGVDVLPLFDNLDELEQEVLRWVDSR